MVRPKMKDPINGTLILNAKPLQPKEEAPKTPWCLVGNGGMGYGEYCWGLYSQGSGFRVQVVVLGQGLGFRVQGLLLGIIQGLLQGSIPPFPTKHRGENGSFSRMPAAGPPQRCPPRRWLWAPCKVPRRGMLPNIGALRITYTIRVPLKGSIRATIRAYKDLVQGP